MIYIWSRGLHKQPAKVTTNYVGLQYDGHRPDQIILTRQDVEDLLSEDVNTRFLLSHIKKLLE